MFIESLLYAKKNSICFLYKDFVIVNINPIR